MPLAYVQSSWIADVATLFDLVSGERSLTYVQCDSRTLQRGKYVIYVLDTFLECIGKEDYVFQPFQARLPVKRE